MRSNARIPRKTRRFFDFTVSEIRVKLVKLWRKSGSELLPSDSEKRDNGERAGDSDQRTGEDIQRPVGSDIHATESYQSGWNKRNPATAAVEEETNRGHCEAVRSVGGGEGPSGGGGSFDG